MFGYVFVSVCKVNADQYNSNRTVMTHGQGIYSNISVFYNKICAVISASNYGVRCITTGLHRSQRIHRGSSNHAVGRSSHSNIRQTGEIVLQKIASSSPARTGQILEMSSYMPS